MSRFSAIDLSQLSAPQLIDALDYESVLAALMEDVNGRFQAAGVDYDVGGLETDPVKIVLEIAAYRELILRALVNDKARAVLIAYAVGSDLDHLGALFGTTRKVLVPASGTSAAVMESDADYRRRIQLAPEAFSVAGPAGAYVYFALSAASEIADAHAFSPADGRVTVVIAGADGAQVSDASLAAVVDRFELADTVPLTDAVSVQRAALVEVPVQAVLTLSRGPDPDLVAAQAQAQVLAYFASRYRIGLGVYRSGLMAALSVGGVDSVALSEPANDVDLSDTEIAIPGAVTIETNVV